MLVANICYGLVLGWGLLVSACVACGEKQAAWLLWGKRPSLCSNHTDLRICCVPANCEVDLKATGRPRLKAVCRTKWPPGPGKSILAVGNSVVNLHPADC